MTAARFDGNRLSEPTVFSFLHNILRITDTFRWSHGERKKSLLLRGHFGIQYYFAHDTLTFAFAPSHCGRQPFWNIPASYHLNHDLNLTINGRALIAAILWMEKDQGQGLRRSLPSRWIWYIWNTGCPNIISRTSQSSSLSGLSSKSHFCEQYQSYIGSRY